ncbi:MAG: DsbE family thiol:disulfide interchange protein [Alphaproteobacteria bacterium]|nr:MAG: DsbE family thiol:disulfide interchange protein [Alphaproteobacteria bacterium]
MTWRAFLPIGVFLVLAVALFVGLGRNASIVPSALVGKPVPTFALPALDDQTRGFTSADLKGNGLSLVNVFASWCAPCRAEHPQLMALGQRDDVTLYAINYKDDPAKARAFLDKLGDPFAAIGADPTGRVSIDWGVYGVPETYIVNARGEIIYKHVGPIMPQDLEAKIVPLLDGAGS